jgi:hypothetical protein
MILQTTLSVAILLASKRAATSGGDTVEISETLGVAAGSN